MPQVAEISGLLSAILVVVGEVTLLQGFPNDSMHKNFGERDFLVMCKSQNDHNEKHGYFGLFSYSNVLFQRVSKLQRIA